MPVLHLDPVERSVASLPSPPVLLYHRREMSPQVSRWGAPAHDCCRACGVGRGVRVFRSIRVAARSSALSLALLVLHLAIDA